MGSSAKTGNFFIGGSQEHFFGSKTWKCHLEKDTPDLHIKSSLYVCWRVQGSQIFKQNWIILICSRVIVILLIWVYVALGCGAGRWGSPGWSFIVYMSSGMFRGKESSNRIELSQLVQDLLNFGVLGSLQLWGGGRWVGVVWGHEGCSHAHACMHAHTHVKKLHVSGVFPVFPVFPMSSPLSPCCPCHPHIIPVTPTSSLKPHLTTHPTPPPPEGPPESVKIQ